MRAREGCRGQLGQNWVLTSTARRGIIRIEVKVKKKTRQSKLTVAVPQELRREARAKAIREGTSVSALIRRWLTGYVAQPEPEQEVDTKRD